MFFLDWYVINHRLISNFQNQNLIKKNSNLSHGVFFTHFNNKRDLLPFNAPVCGSISKLCILVFKFDMVLSFH